MIIVGFTGSRRGMTSQQRGAFAQWLAHQMNMFGVRQLHHGCEEHSDDEAARIAQHAGIMVIGHPGPGSKSTEYDVVLKPQPYLERNRAIVDSSDVLVACPDGPEKLRSGTWATVRYARKQNTPVITIDRKGNVVEDDLEV